MKKNEELNSMVFTPEEVERGMVDDLLKYLIDYNTKSEERFNEIMITSDSYCTIVNWINVPIERDYGGRFEFLRDDECIAKEVILPDNSSHIVMSKEEEDGLWNDYYMSQVKESDYDLPPEENKQEMDEGDTSCLEDISGDCANSL